VRGDRVKQLRQDSGQDGLWVSDENAIRHSRCRRELSQNRLDNPRRFEVNSAVIGSPTGIRYNLGCCSR
jgi:hypothetical protein